MMKKNLTCVFILQELDLWGGDFYADGLFPIFTQIGPQLTKLNLVRAFNNMNAITITTSCMTVHPGACGRVGQPSPNHLVSKYPKPQVLKRINEVKERQSCD